MRYEMEKYIDEKYQDTPAGIREIAELYSDLDLQFSCIAQAVLRWSIKREGFIIEASESEDKEARDALAEIDRTLAKLISAEKKYRFNQRNLYNVYKEELQDCQQAILRMTGSLNTIWKYGQPGKHGEVPFNGTTNYHFIYGRLKDYVKQVNDRSTSISIKAARFNRENRDLPPLSPLSSIAIPSWVSRINFT